VHRTTDGGMSWETISPDLTTNDRALQDYAGGPVDHDITGVEVFNTVFSLAVSPHSETEIWAGTDDGRVHLTRDGGASWSDVTPPGLPERGTVDEIDLSIHQPGRAFVAVQRYREDDWRPYIFRTDDFGGTWESLATGTNGIPADYPVRTVREDPVRPGLIYAGTEFGVFVSFDDGRNWQSLQLDLPITPVTGMRVAHDDLILSTQGRSFWILDDVTPLRQLDPAVAGSAVHLFAPRTAYRSNASDDADGQGEWAPEPLPGKALIHYYLAEEPEGGVRVRIHDTADRLVREFTSDSATAEKERIGRMKVKAGMNRLAWDLTYAGPTTLKEAVISGYDGGVKAPPGTYRVSLEAAGESRTSPLVVAADPRQPRVALEDYGEQYRLAAAIRDTVTRVYDGLRQIRSVSEQVTSIGERIVKEGYPAELGELADTVGAKLGAVEDALRQTKNESNQDALRYPPRLDTQYLNLYAYVTGEDNYSFGGPDGRPSAGAYERFEDLNAEWAILRQRLRTVLETDVPAFNEALRRNGVEAVIVPRGVGPPLVP
jgi:hypothetical protein